MDKVESEKFNQTISEAYEDLIVCRPEKPLEHFIYRILSTLPADQRNKDQKVRQFYKEYADGYVKNVKKII